MRTKLGLFVLQALFLTLVSGSDDVYDVGVGIADITGPSAEVELFGYATFKQPSSGIHFRTYSRAFIISQNGTRIVHVTADLGSVSEILKIKVVEDLKAMYGDLYTLDNFVLSATHTHSAPGGYHQFLLYAAPIAGFIAQAFEAARTGIVQSIVQAHESLKPGKLYYNTGKLYGANVNRSPTAYANNPSDERQKYEADVDKIMRVLKITDINGNPLGAITWFPVHPTSMNNTNQLVSGDNKGYASMRFEREINGKGVLTGKGPFVASFPNANHGDTSPNILGPKCIDTGLPCDLSTSTCNGKSANCIAFGPGKDMFESTKIIGEMQFTKALELFNSAVDSITGDVQFIHQHIDMSSVIVNNDNGETASTCKSAMGYSFAAGTTDGPGLDVFSQGTTGEGTPFWNFIRIFVKSPSKKLIKCQSPKPILLSTGEMTFPYDWQPQIVPTQILKIGKLVIVPVPGEFTTMSGRRLQNAVADAFQQVSLDDTMEVVVQSLSNEYTSYIATFEEFQVQRYEGASTIYGPHTLEAYMEQYSNLAINLAKRIGVVPGPNPPDLLNKQITLQPGVIYDGKESKYKFGQVTVDAHDIYKIGETVSVEFVSGHPKNDLRLGGTYLTVERLGPFVNWTIVATDTDWETKFQWRRTNSILGYSRVTVTWDITEEVTPGEYRISHFGKYKTLLQSIKPYSGTSRTFKVLPPTKYQRP